MPVSYHIPFYRRLEAIILLVMLFFMAPEISGQYFTIGTDPASVKWNQVKTPHYKVIYPMELDSQALYFANAMEYFHEPGAASLGKPPRKWPVIFHNRTLISNAYVPYAPKRMEIVTTPPQDNLCQPWIDGLVIHEFRHTVQYTTINRGLTKALSVVFGQQAVPGIIGLFVPLWFIEGDAVVIETATSKTGRGRTPAFEMKLRAQFLEKGIYSYDKAVNESYRDFTPDRYELGYQLVGRTRADYGPETWKRAIETTGEIPLMMVPFSNTLYKETGYGKSRLYQKITGDMLREWQYEDSLQELTPAEPLLTLGDKFYTSRTQPVVLNNGHIAARKTSLDDITRIVMLDSTGGECILLNPGSMIDEGLSGSGNLVCWAELEPDPRWDLRDHSVIMIYDLSTGKLRQVTKRTRYFSPALSPDGGRIAAIEVDSMNFSHLVIIDAATGTPLQKMRAPENFFLSYPAWSGDGTSIALIMTRQEGKCLALADPASGKIECLLPSSYTEISKPAFYKNYILFTGAYTGTDNIFAFNLDTRKLYKVTTARFGATDAAIDPENQVLYYADYTAGGYRLVSAPLQPETWGEIDPMLDFNYPLAEALARQENFIYKPVDIPDTAYPVKRYRKFPHAFNFHSWAPLSIDVDHMELNPGVTLLAQNLLGTSYATIGYEWDMNEETGKYYLKYSYEGLFPVLDLETDYGMRRGVHDDGHGNLNEYKYHELNFAAGLRVPLSWNVRSWFLGFQPYAGYSLKFLRMDPKEDLEFRKDRINSSDNRIFMYAQSRRAYRDLQPRWGQLVELNFRKTLLDADTSNSIFAAEAQFYLPGLFKHHGFRVYGGYQDRVRNYYRYGGLINVPRGYSGITADEAVSASVTYAFPVCYPDLNLGPVIYFKRVKAGLFYDFMAVFEPGPENYYHSIGLDLTVDFHLFRLFAPLEAGLRTAYLPGDGTLYFEFLYSINIADVY